MASVTNGPVQGSAYRARRFGVWQLHRLGSRYGELPMAALPGAVPATDSAAAPRPHAGPSQRARRRAMPKPDPDYERKLEELAENMLGPAAAADLTAAADSTGAKPVDGVADTAAGSAASCAPDSAASRATSRATSRAASREADTASGTARSPSGNPSRSAPRPADTPRPRYSEADSRGRREPSMEPLQTEDAFHAIRQRHARQRRSRMLAGALVMAVAVGLGSAWWLGKLDQIDAVAALNTHAGRLVASLDRKPTSESSGASGTSEAKAGNEEPARAGKNTSSADAKPALRASPSLQAPQDTPDPAPVVVTPTPAPPAAAPARASSEAADATTPSASQNVSKPAVASVDARKKKERNRDKTAEARARAEKHKPPQVATAKAGKKPSAGNPDKRDDDIDRLRSQAYGESSRDREQRMRPTPTPPSPQSAVAVTPISTGAESRVSYKKELAQCEKIDGLFYQERCKWRICKDQWGTHGCPSFPQQSVRF